MTLKKIYGVVLVAFCMLLSLSFNPAIATTGNKPAPVLKPGLWNITSSDSIMPTHITNEKRCVGVRKLEMRATNDQYKHDIRQCSVTDIVVAARKIEYVRKCEPDPGAVRTFKVVYEGDFSKKFEQASTLSIGIASAFEGAAQKVAHKFVGVCPKSMKPGDVILTNDAGSVIAKWNRYDPKDPLRAAIGQKRN